MHKLLFTFTIGILALWIGGCGSQPAEEEATSTPSPTTSPTPTATASPDPTKAASPTPNEAKPPFKEPLVEEKSDVASQAGLIQSTKAEERLIQLQGGAQNRGVTVAPATTQGRPAPQRVDDPFAVLPPVIVEPAPDDPADGGVARPPELTAQQVPQLPELPVVSRPPQWRTAVAVAQQQAPSGTPTRPPQAQPQTVPDLPELPISSVPPRWQSPVRPRTQPQNRQPGVPSRPQTQPQNRQPGVPSRPQTQPQNRQPSIPSQQQARPIPRVPTLPVASTASVPDLPELPISGTPPAWRDPNQPVAVAPSATPLPIPEAPAAPPPPSTDIALGVEVTGVLEVGGKTQVILKAPTEPTSRYVSVGQRVAGGEVLVKRVKFDTGGEPIVILEQNGVEIAKLVGETNSSPQQSLNTLILSRSLK